MRTQKGWLKKHPDADMDSAIAEFREALSAYGRGEKFAQKALEDAELYTQMRQSAEGKAALQILQKLYGMATRGDTYLMAGDDGPQKTKSTAFIRALIPYFRWNTGLSTSVS